MHKQFCAKTMSLTNARKALRIHADPKKARLYRRYFKDSKDVFLGVTTAWMRKLAREYSELPLAGVRELMKSSVHDERSLANSIWQSVTSGEGMSASRESFRILHAEPENTFASGIAWAAAPPISLALTC